MWKSCVIESSSEPAFIELLMKVNVLNDYAFFHA